MNCDDLVNKLKCDYCHMKRRFWILDLSSHVSGCFRGGEE
jgi:hypothetical protein